MAIDTLVTKWDEGKDLENTELVALCKDLTERCRKLIQQSLLKIVIDKNGVEYIPFDARALPFIAESYDKLDHFLDAVK